ncbi:hypothetical protein RN001_003445 [Aquatica leii]|uniref:Ion transport domain-containing protein n=1 Tax=Aquatica leii TaxID=1421715 RepID=A0AAN7SMB3_9COLE|nr:hypothetical protein RN001_003445 [Aquatica leii]
MFGEISNLKIDVHPLDAKFHSDATCDVEVEDILKLYPELANGARGMYSITALQVAAAFTKKGVTPLIERLLMYGNVNQEDELGRTPLHYAAMNGNTELVELLLNSGADTECKFLYHQSTFRSPKEDYNKWNKLYTMFPPPDGWGRTPLHPAVKEGHVEVVRLLIKRNANVNAQDEAGVTPLLLAGGSKNNSTFEDIVELLVNGGADVNLRNNVTDTTALFHAVTLKSKNAVNTLLKAGAWLTEGPSYQTELHEAASNGTIDIIEMFLNDPRITLSDINKCDRYGRSPLHKAALGGHRECIKMFLKSGGNLLGCAQLGKENIIDVIFSRLARPADFLKEVLDSTITLCTASQAHENYKVNLDFSILAPHGNDLQMEVIWGLVSAASEKEKVCILQHPLIEAFLQLKWTKICHFFYFLIIAYATFVLCFSIYVILAIHNTGLYEYLTEVFRWFVFVIGGGLSIHACIQFVLSIRRYFFKQYELWMNLSCTVLSVVIALHGFRTVNGQIATVYEEIPEWCLHVSSLAILLAWSELMLLIGRSPSYGYYALMFAAVLQNIIKVLVTFVCLVVGFALSFSIQFHGYYEFSNPWVAIVKTTVMMMGEFQYDDLFQEKNRPDEKVLRTFTIARIIFMCFIILASIVLMNLMVGVAVNDIQGLQEEGHARRLEKQVEFLRQLEKVISFKAINSVWFPSFLRNFLRRKRYISLKLTIQPEHMGFISYDPKKPRKLPYELIESIVSLANTFKEQEDKLKNAKLPELLEALKKLLNQSEINI